MQKIGTNYIQKLRSPEVITGVASGILAALILEAVSEAIQKSLNHQIIGFFLMAVIALICLILVGFFLMRIQKLVENRNYTRFITSKAARLYLMTECIKNAKSSIYMISDLSSAKESDMDEHKNYIAALNKVMADNKGNPTFKLKRIVVPPSDSGIDTETNLDWVYDLLGKPEFEKAYKDHFIEIHAYKDTVLRHAPGPRKVSMILIDNKHLFWKPEMLYGHKGLDTLMGGGLYLEDYTQEGIADFTKAFEDIYERAPITELDKLGWPGLEGDDDDV